jgi:hypothetical protein
MTCAPYFHVAVPRTLVEATAPTHDGSLERLADASLRWRRSTFLLEPRKRLLA